MKMGIGYYVFVGLMVWPWGWKKREIKKERE